MSRIRQRSGNVDTNDVLVVFLYVLLRDHVHPSTIEELLKHQIASVPETYQLSNGWLAQYAQDIADRLRPVQEVAKEPPAK